MDCKCGFWSNMKAQFSNDRPKSACSHHMASLCICTAFFKEVITQSQRTWDGISTLSLPCVILGKLLSLNDLVYKMVIITPSSQVCSSDTIHRCYSCKLWDGGEISEDSQRHQGAFHPQTDLTSPELPAHPSFWSLWGFSPKGDLAAEQGALCKWPGELSPSRAAAPSFVKEEFWGYQKGSQIVFGKTIAK